MDQTDVASVHHAEIGSEAAHPGRVFVPSPVMRGEARRTWLSPVWKWLAELLNGPHLVWHRHGAWLGYLNLYCQRKALQAYNLFDVGVTMPADRIPVSGYGDPPPMGRTADGSGTDARCPITGMTGTRFGRNIPLSANWPDAARLFSPNPQHVADRLLTRHAFIPATRLNMLAAAWIQFMVHDWVTHGDNDTNHVEIPAPNDSGAAMRIRGTPKDLTRQPDEAAYPPTYVNRQTQWWDGSQIYGSTPKKLQSLRTGSAGKLRLGSDGLLVQEVETWKGDHDPALKEQTGVNDNWWIGLSLFHTLFTHEHNAICDRLIKAYPAHADDDEWLFAKARLVTAALMAKIHVLEWTAQTGAHPSLKLGVKLAWRGLLGHCFDTEWLIRNQRLRTWPRWLVRLIDRIPDGHAILTGMPGSPTEDHGVPFSMTEEFVAAYRMHPLLPDEFKFHSAQDGRMIGACKFDGVVGVKARQLAETIGMEDLFYSFGVIHPGALTLHNFPQALRAFVRQPSAGEAAEAPQGERIDLAVIDIMRDRERGLPRYNEFREWMHLPRVPDFKALNATNAAELESLYKDIDAVDLMVGMLAETPPPGFAYSDTAFRVFVLMASRRLEADRFFTSDYNDDVYTKVGIRWVEENDLKKVLLRNYSGLKDVLPKDFEDIFTPWPQPVLGTC